MSVAHLKHELATLSLLEINELRAYLDELESAAFDTQLEEDSAAGRFDAFISNLESKIKIGDWKPL